jgi:hypothetical protein
MANRARPTLQKRQRERERQQRQKDKLARREESKQRRATAPDRAGEQDPDIDHIVPGPQPLADWQIEMKEEEEAAKKAAEQQQQADE